MKKLKLVLIHRYYGQWMWAITNTRGKRVLCNYGHTYTSKYNARRAAYRVLTLIREGEVAGAEK